MLISNDCVQVLDRVVHTNHSSQHTWSKTVLRFKPIKAFGLGSKNISRRRKVFGSVSGCWRSRHATEIGGRPTTFNANVDAPGIPCLWNWLSRCEGGGFRFEGSNLPSVRLQIRSKLEKEHELLSSLHLNGSFSDWSGSHQVILQTAP